MTYRYEERDRQRASMAFDPVQKAKGYNSHPSGVETVQVTEWLLGMTATAVKYVWRRGEKWETQLAKIVRQLDDAGTLFKYQDEETVLYTKEGIARAKRDAVIQDLEKALWCFEREGERLKLPMATSLWDGPSWRPYAMQAVRLDGDTVLGRCLGALLMAPQASTLQGAIEECCRHVGEELERLKEDHPEFGKASLE